MKLFKILLLFSFLLVFSENTFAQETKENSEFEIRDRKKGHLFSYYTIHDPNYSWTSVVRFLGAKSLFYTAVLPVFKYSLIKPEVIAGNVNETTLWYSVNLPFLGLFAGPGVSYSFDPGQGFRLRWQYGFGTPTLSEDIPLSFFLLSNITHDFRSDTTVWDWFNFGIAYQLDKRVKIQVDMEGNWNGNPYTYSNFGFVLDL